MQPYKAGGMASWATLCTIDPIHEQGVNHGPAQLTGGGRGGGTGWDWDTDEGCCYLAQAWSLAVAGRNSVLRSSEGSMSGA